MKGCDTHYVELTKVQIRLLLQWGRYANSAYGHTGDEQELFKRLEELV